MIDIIGRDKIWKIIIETIFSSSGMSLEKINKWTFYLISCENQHLTNFFFEQSIFAKSLCIGRSSVEKLKKSKAHRLQGRF